MLLHFHQWSDALARNHAVTMHLLQLTQQIARCW